MNQVLINEHTKIIGRFHPEANIRGLNIYNPYFQELGINSIYLLFQNMNPQRLIEGMRCLNIKGAIVAGPFEKDKNIIDFIDEVHPISTITKTIGVLSNFNGKIFGSYQGAFGLDYSIRNLVNYEDKKIIILGAGVLTKGFLAFLQINNISLAGLEVYNRTVSHTEALAKEFSFISKIGTIDDLLENSCGDVFINATDIGSISNRGEELNFSEEFVQRFDYIVDSTYSPLQPQLVVQANKFGKKVSPGYKLFAYQGKYVLEQILGIEVNIEHLEKIVLKAFSNTGAVSK